MSERTYRAAMIGCGRVTQHYVRILTELDPVERFQVVACCDLIPAKAQQVCAALGATQYTEAARMIAESKPDVVLVLTPSGLHFQHAQLALNAGCHVLSEKPVSLIPEQAYQLAKLASQKGLYYGGVFQNRYNPAIRKLREVMGSNRLGTIVSAAIRLRWCRTQDYYQDGWHGTWLMDGGVINQQAIHHLDALNWICGPIESVCALTANRVNHLEAEDTMVASLRFSDGSLGTIEVTTAARPEDFEASLSVVGDGGIVQIGGIALNRIDIWRFVKPMEGDADIPRKWSQEVPTGYGLGHGPLLRDWVVSLDAGAVEPPVPALQAVKAVELVHALYASVEQDGWVRLADNPRSKRLGHKARSN